MLQAVGHVSRFNWHRNSASFRAIQYLFFYGVLLLYHHILLLFLKVGSAVLILTLPQGYAEKKRESNQAHKAKKDRLCQCGCNYCTFMGTLRIKCCTFMGTLRIKCCTFMGTLRIKCCTFMGTLRIKCCTLWVHFV